MLFTGIANPAQLKMLTAALVTYCRNENIELGTPEHEEAGRLVMAQFNSGVLTMDKLGPHSTRHEPGRASGA